MNISIVLLCAVLLIAFIISLAAWLESVNELGESKRQHPPRHRGLRRTWRKFYLLPIGIHRLIGFMPGQRLRTGVQFANIGEGSFDTGVKAYLPDAATSSRYLLYKVGTDVDHCAICGAGDDPIGSSDDQAEVGVPLAINVFGACRGTIRVVSDGTVNNGDYVKAGATGKVTQAATTNLSFGRAIIGTDCTKADGDVITIIPMVPAKYVF